MKHIFYFTKQIHAFSGRRLYINLVGMVLVSLLEGVGILLLIPFINSTGLVAVKGSSIGIISWISSLFHGLGQTTSFSIILGSYILLIIIQSFFQRKQVILNGRIQQGFIKLLRENTYQLLLRANWSFFLNKRKSDIINLMTSEITLVSAGTNMFLQFLTNLVFTSIQIGFAFWLSLKMTMLVIIFGFAIILFSRKFVSNSNQIGKETFELSESYLAGITDHFNGIKEIKSNLLEDSHLSWFRSISKKMEKNRINLIKVNSTSQSIYKIISAIIMSILLFTALTLFRAQPAQLILIVMIFTRIWPRFSGIQSDLEQLSAIIPSFRALKDLQDECVALKELSGTNFNDVLPIKVENSIECKNVSFRYTKEEGLYALQNINVKLPANLMTAIVGRSGAGKSTLIDLLMGLNQPEKGEVLIDGNILKQENLPSLRKSVSYVPQDPFLFNTTIKENLLMTNEHATEEQLWEALEFSAASKFVRKLPNGMDTLIGDRGIKLSGGERQRLVLARAILRKPSILVLDEATSSLDTENESIIQEALEKLKGTMTIIIIAHRLSTIRNADQVLVLDQGKIIQSGEFTELASEKRGVFSNLLGKQIEISV